MSSVQRSITIAAPPGQIFDVLAEVERLTEIMPGLERVWDVRRGPDGLPTAFRWKFRMVGMTFEGDMVVDEFVRGERAVNRSVEGLQSLWRWECGPAGDATRLTLTIEYTVPGGGLLGAIANKLVVERQNEQAAEQALANVKRLAEAVG